MPIAKFKIRNLDLDELSPDQVAAIKQLILTKLLGVFFQVGPHTVDLAKCEGPTPCVQVTVLPEGLGHMRGLILDPPATQAVNDFMDQVDQVAPAQGPPREASDFKVSTVASSSH